MPHSQRSTPAHAGNTRACRLRARPRAVYPRPRGEYALNHANASSHIGLPPPTRGILNVGIDGIYAIRSTPAHAGNTVSIGNGQVKYRVYPRPRGEYGLFGDMMPV